MPDDRQERAADGRLEIFSDAICPWCYVAQRRLRRAIASTPRLSNLTVRWRPFQLNPDMPKGGLGRREYRTAKFGSWEHSQRLDAQVAAVGEDEGLVFRHDRIARTPNTLDAHRLLWLAEQEGVQEDVAEGIFKAYFTDGKDIGAREIPADIGAASGLSWSEMLQFLNGEEGTQQVELQEAEAREMGLSGVPTFVLDGRPIFSGALKAEVIAARLQGEAE